MMRVGLRTFGLIGLAAVAIVPLVPGESHGQASRVGGAQVTGNASSDAVTTAVLVDVVVRDRRGRPVTDLTADDFEVREDGTSQQLGSFTRVARGAGVAIEVGVKDPATTLVETPARSGAEDEPPVPMVTALVFDALSSTALALSQRAALEYLPRSSTSSSQVGVFTTDPVVRMLQPYTDHPALARQAVQSLMPAGSTVREQQAEQLALARQRRDALEVQASAAMAATTAQLGTASGNIGQLEMERRVVRAQLRMMNAFEALDRDHRGLATSGALFGVLQTLVEMPGRKTLVLFSEGLPASPTLQAHLQTVIESANRLNVTVYAVDASGLRALSGMADTRRELEEAGATRLQQQGLMRDDAEEPLTRALERAEDMLRLDSQSGLSRLARSTGGFLIRDTNDLGDAFRRIDEDQRFHYLLTYSPSNQALDGRFRRIDVRVRRPGVRVFARDGYRALRVPPSIPVRASEAPALAALDAATLPDDVAFGSTALTFPQPDGTSVLALLVRLSTSVLTFDDRAGGDTYRADAMVVVRLKDAAGNIAEQLSQEYQFTGRLEDMETARRGDVLFYRRPRVAPGIYTLEAAVHDGVSGRTGARVATVSVDASSVTGPRVSDVVLVRRTEDADTTADDGGNPLQVGHVLLYPSTGEPWSRTHDGALAFYVAIHPVSTAGTVAADVLVRRGGRTLARVPTPLAAPDESGVIHHQARLPLDALDAGLYELVVEVRDASGACSRSAYFRVVP
jgi:VWFA-related protein